MPRPSIYIVDAFSRRAYAGNPAAVCLLEDEAEASWMQTVAGEMNLSETAFVGPPDASGRRSLRWFTPVVEIDLCGHATLASAHVLWECAAVAEDGEIVFSTRSGDLRARRADPGGAADVAGRISLDFPLRRPVEVERPAGLAQALGVYPTYVGRAEDILLAELRSAEEVRSVRPDMKTLAGIAAHGIIVTAPGESGEHDFVSRYFAPQVGIDEDPVTGSAHCVLGPFWADRIGRTSLLGHQASARGGDVWVEVAEDRVVLGGQAITVVSGILHAGP